MIRSVSLLLVGCLLADPVAASIQGIVPPTPAPGLYTPASSPSIYNEQALEPFLNWMRQPLEWDAIRALGSSIAEAWKDVTDQFPRIEVLEAETVGSFSGLPIIEITYAMKKSANQGGNSGSGNITRKQETAVAKFVGDLTLEQLEDLVRIKWGQSDVQTSRAVREMLQHLLQRYPDHQERLRIRAEAYRQAEALYPQRLNEAKQAFVAGLTEANLQDLVRMKLGMEDQPITSDVGERLKHLLQYYPNPLEQLGTRGEIYREAEALLAPRLTEAKQTFLAGLSESEQHELLFIKVGRDTSDTSAALRQKLNQVLQISPDPEQQFAVRADIYAEAAALIAQRIPTVVLKFLAGLTTEELHELIMIRLGRDTPEHFAALHQKLNHLIQPYADPDQQKAVYTELYHQAYVLSAVRREGEVLKKVLAPRPGGTPRPPEVLMEVGGSLIQELATEYTSADVEGRAPLVDALALVIMIWWDEHPRENHYDETIRRKPRDRRNYIPDLVLQRCERDPDPVWGVEVFTLLAEKYTHRDDVARFLVGRGNIFARSETLQKAFEPMLLEISAARPKLLAIRIMEARSAGKSDAVNQWLDHLLLLHAEKSSVPVIVRTLLRLIYKLKLGTVTPGTLLILETENDGPLTEVSAVERLGPKAMVAWMQSMILQIAQLSPAHKRTVVQQIEKRIQRLHQVDGEELLRRVREASTKKLDGGTAGMLPSWRPLHEELVMNCLTWTAAVLEAAWVPIVEEFHRIFHPELTAKMIADRHDFGFNPDLGWHKTTAREKATLLALGEACEEAAGSVMQSVRWLGIPFLIRVFGALAAIGVHMQHNYRMRWEKKLPPGTERILGMVGVPGGRLEPAELMKRVTAWRSMFTGLSILNSDRPISQPLADGSETQEFRNLRSRLTTVLPLIQQWTTYQLPRSEPYNSLVRHLLQFEQRASAAVFPPSHREHVSPARWLKAGQELKKILDEAAASLSQAPPSSVASPSTAPESASRSLFDQGLAEFQSAFKDKPGQMPYLWWNDDRIVTLIICALKTGVVPSISRSSQEPLPKEVRQDARLLPIYKEMLSAQNFMKRGRAGYLPPNAASSKFFWEWRNAVRYAHQRLKDQAGLTPEESERINGLVQQASSKVAHDKSEHTGRNGGTWWWISDAYRETARAYGKVVGWILMPVVIEGITVLSLSLGASSVFFHSVISTANPAVLWAPLLIWLVAHVGDPAIKSPLNRFGKVLVYPAATAVLTMIAFFVTGHFVHGPLGPGALALIIAIPHLVVLSVVKAWEWRHAPAPDATAPAKTETTEPTPLAGPVDFFATHPVARKFPVRVTRISRANLTIELAPSTWYDGLELAQSYMTRWKTQRVSWEYSFFGRATSKEIAQFRRATALDMTFLGQPINVTALEPTMHQLYGANQRWFPIDVGFMPYVTDDRGEPAQWLALKNQGIVCLWTAFQVAVNSQDDARKRWLYVFLKEVLKLPKDVPNEALDPSITLLRGFWEKYVKNVADARDKLDKMPRPLGPQALLNQRGDALYRLHVAVNEIDPLLYRLSLAPPSLKQTAELDPKGDARKKALQTFYTTSIKLKKLGWNWEEVGSNLRLGLSHSGELLNLITLARHRYYRQADELLTTLFTSGVAAPSDILRLIHILAEYETSLTPDIEAKFELKSHHNFAKSRQDLAALRERFVALIKSVEVAPGQRWIVLGRVEIKDKKIKTPYYVVAPVKKWLLDTGMDNKDVRIVAEDDPWFAPFLPLVGASPKPVQSTLSHTHLSLMASMLLAAVLLPFYLYSTQPHPHDLHHSLKVSA